MQRRDLLGVAAGVAAGTAIGVPTIRGVRGSTSTGQVLRTELPLPDPFTVPLPVPSVLAANSSDATGDHYELTQRPADVEILPKVSTRIWGYNGSFPGPTIVSKRDRRTVVTHHNKLPVPVVVHLHGGHTPHAHDGYPTDMILPTGVTPDQVPGPGDTTQLSREYVYPMGQPAATLWYHDHRMDFTGPSVWQGLAGFHLITDEVEHQLGLPHGERDLPLMITDRAFAHDGSLQYPALDPDLMATPGVHEPYSAGVLGDVILVNGAPWPEKHVPAVRHRLRLLNASNARRYRLALDPPPPGGQGLVQIGSDMGLLAAPATHDAIDLAPAQRFDVVIDFARYKPGQLVTVTNTFGETDTTRRVLRFRVGDRVTDDSRVPAQLAPVHPLQKSAAVRTRTFMFRSEQIHGRHGWTINGEPFSVDHIHAQPRLGTVEIWRLIADFHHPVHLHLSPFQILSRGTGGPGPYDAGWKDTIDLRPAEAAAIIVRFDDFAGKYVFHCHNLEHEDMMMMGNFWTTR